MAWAEIEDRPNDIERQEAENMGIGGYGGEDTNHKILRQTVMPSEEE